MSADNWTDCPKCSKKLKEQIEQSYGKVSPEEYQKLLKLSSEYQDDLGEYYQIYMDYLGELSISYRCSCRRCGFEFKFDHKENVLKQSA